MEVKKQFPRTGTENQGSLIDSCERGCRVPRQAVLAASRRHSSRPLPPWRLFPVVSLCRAGWNGAAGMAAGPESCTPCGESSELRTKRNPMLLLELPGLLLLLRLAARQLPESLFQLPPRSTRLEPDTGHGRRTCRVPPSRKPTGDCRGPPRVLANDRRIA